MADITQNHTKYRWIYNGPVGPNFHVEGLWIRGRGLFLLETFFYNLSLTLGKEFDILGYWIYNA